MDKTKIKNFAVWAREKLITDIKYKASLLGITDGNIADELSQSTADLKFYDIGTKEYAEVSGNEIKQREALVKAIKSKEKDCGKYIEAFDFVVEEVAYTWFNRLVAIHFMEVNDYLPSGVRVLSSESNGKIEPDLVTSPFDTDLEFTPFEQDKIIQLKDENKLDDLFRMLFVKQCNKLHEILPELFEKTDDYTELLLTLSFTDKDGVVYRLVHDIDEEDFDIEHLAKDGTPNGQVEVIGWMYQYYISAKHDEIINIYKGTIKKDDIPAATQLFTTDWVVRYMVDNSLGRYWIERNPNSRLADKLDFYVKPKDGRISYVDEKIDPSDLTFFDPCMGSGHILVYAFDVLMEIYRECGYTDRDAAQNIVENNLYGLDIDKRAYQLAYFALMMKARSYNRRILTRGIKNNLAYIEESNNINQFYCENLTNDKEQNKIGEYLVEVYKHAQEYGSLQCVENKDYDSFVSYLDRLDDGHIDLFTTTWLTSVYPVMYKLTKQAKIMSNKYAVVCTNPPYMNKFEGHLKEFIQEKFKDYKGDLFSAFMFRNFGYCKKDGYSAFMTPFVWMFIKTYEKLREYIISQKSITSLIQMEYSAFEEATVPICSFVLKNSKAKDKALCFRLSDFKGGMTVQKDKVLNAIEHPECGYFYETDQNDLSNIPGSPIAYWACDTLISAFKNESLYTNSISPSQNITGNNPRFVRKHWELEKTKVGGKDDWIFYAKGGGYRKWWGNLYDVVNWTPQARYIYQHGDGKHASQIINKDYWYKKGITWGLITSALPSFRVMPEGATFDKGGSSIIVTENVYNFSLGLLNSKVYLSIVTMLNPTLNFQVKDIRSMPLVLKNLNKIDMLVKECIDISKYDWDSFETSWEFNTNPLVLKSKSLWDATSVAASMQQYYGNDLIQAKCPIELSYLLTKGESKYYFEKIRNIEEELNQIFIDIYGLEDELTPDISEKDITVHYIFDSKNEIPKSMSNSKYALTKQDIIKDFISYSVGCMFGRYDLNSNGLIYAGGKWDPTKYSAFMPDVDNCIPITDEEYFEDDIVGRFADFVSDVFGEDSLEDNLMFIANSLGNKGNSPKEVIRNYFLNDFIKDHTKKYQKCPIYWMFDSGKQNGFKALVYMHRWNSDTVGNLRVEYLHKIQRVYEKEIERMQEIIDNSKNNKEISAANKRKEKLQKQLKETKDYDAKIAHIALSQIDIDLDDGVKVNYEKVQTAQDGKKMQILVKI